ncbi:hypothetical protein L1987_59555 [Smallanthus sonchifolius]|uniref:Uncharacterized protein n=1 Tax=Smallanthus sonchifolius TaxID=185202 RepID=A0ACB9D5J9_9ASTR|nr:hypothetical protein L1987_59555 [Smallanthus sonchifolius]
MKRYSHFPSSGRILLQIGVYFPLRLRSYGTPKGHGTNLQLGFQSTIYLHSSTTKDSRSEIEDFDRAIAISLAEVKRKHAIIDDFLLKEDEHLAKALLGSLKLEPPHWNRNMNQNRNVHQPIPFPHSTSFGFYCREIVRITSLATKKTITNDVMFATTLCQQMMLVLLNIKYILYGIRNTARIMSEIRLLGVVVVIVSRPAMLMAFIVSLYMTL